MKYLIKNKTVDNYEEVLLEISNYIKKSYEYNSYSYNYNYNYNYLNEIENILKKFYFNKKINIIKILIGYFNNIEINTEVNIIQDLLNNPILNLYEKAIKQYLYKLEKCGFIIKTNKKELVYKILYKIPTDLKSTDLTNKNKIKFFQRKSKLDKIYD